MLETHTKQVVLTSKLLYAVCQQCTIHLLHMKHRVYHAKQLQKVH